MSASAKTTTDHSTIKKWAEARDGKPATVKGTGHGDEAGLLRINFPGGAEDSLEDISWDEFFQKFEEKKLAFLYQDEKDSTFNKLVNRD
ncbi:MULTISPECIES: hypothetical protein [Rufibacter]|uniref:1,4-alpha-glucan branching enzyme n=1 Tax=Rufibacter quisquiliarum TaxID=1549639 RepID=A0A839GHL5_9BACT|nr:MULTISPECIES: hypothetical protein [Rufibacter]MBA9078372.1 hypothetical protein [Rufibacter quisquiliarum]